VNVLEIAKRVKRQFGDEAGAQITDEDIIRWINDAQRDLAASNDLLQTTATTKVVRGQDHYNLPPDLLTLRSVRVSGRKLEPLSNEQAADWAPNTPQQRQGMVTHFSTWALKIDLYPIPDYNDTDDLQLYYTRSPIPVATMDDVPELPLQYHNRIVDYCIAHAHELDDNMEAYKFKMQQFQEGALSIAGFDQVVSDKYPSISVSDRDTDLGHVWYYE
jgi:hypothetical protein